MFSYFNKYINLYKNKYKLNLINKKLKLINLFEKKIEKLKNKELSNKTNEFICRIKNKENIDSILIEAFAVVRESIKRIFGIRLFDVQIIGGIVLHEQCIAEMSTGEGKTLTSTLSAYFNSLYKKGVHIVTMNDYLAKRDSDNNRPLFEFLGITVGTNLHNSSFEDKKKSYLCDVTYGTNYEYCFDYLRDNLVMNLNEKVQRGLYYAIIDEVDSILIDEARTPLIISSQNKDNSKLYIKINSLIKYIINNKFNIELEENKKYFNINYKLKQIDLTDNGFKLIEKLMVNLNFIRNESSLYLPENIILIHHFIISLKAYFFFKKNVDYIIKNNKVIIIDEHTGRAVEERVWSEGLHQAIEAKENLLIQNESENLASITFQNYFRLYNKLSGMTGTAYTEKEELKYIYNLDTIVIPTNKFIIRKDLPDLFFFTENDKIKAIINDVINCVKRKQPVLIGTISIEKSELLSKRLNRININHKVLNAKYNDIEAEIISQAGKPGSVTIATNMAGRGTDIILGGNLNNEINKLNNKDIKYINNIKLKWKLDNKIVIDSGGLHIIGTERHESRRIDNQLKGRSGRQGDPGSSRFYLSIEDQLIKMFISDSMLNIIKNINKNNINSNIKNSFINSLIENHQKILENRNFDIRKQLIIYDDIYNNQRSIIYSIRNNLLLINNLNLILDIIINDVINNILNKFIFLKNRNNIYDYINEINNFLIKNLNFTKFNKKSFINNFSKFDNINNIIIDEIKLIYNNSEKLLDKNKLLIFKKTILIKKLDELWKEHLYIMDNLYQGIYLRSYAQKDPIQEFQLESFNLFNNMLDLWKFESLCILNRFIFNKEKYEFLLNKYYVNNI